MKFKSFKFLFFLSFLLITILTSLLQLNVLGQELDIIKDNDILDVRLIFSIIFLISFCYFLSYIISNYISKSTEKIYQDLISLDKDTNFPIEFYNLKNLINKKFKELLSYNKKIELSQSQQSTIIRSMKVGLLAVDVVGNIIQLNSVSSIIFDIDIKSSKGKLFSTLIRNSDLIKYISKFINSSSFKEESIILSFNGYHFNIIGTNLVNSKSIISGAVFIFNDITAIQNTNKIRKEFVANVSHELKTPITAIKGFVETLQGMEQSNDQNKFLSIISNHSDRLNSIINDLLVLSKLEENKLDNKSLVISNEPLLPLINSAIFECKSLIDNKSINVNIECDTEISILQNSHLLLQAFTNLINNAVKYSKINSDVFIKARKKDSTVELLFIDQGIGIEDKHLPRLFERFYRVDESRSRDAGGTGLGLSIVKHICNLHNAKINVTSSINEGTTFSIIFHN